MSNDEKQSPVQGAHLTRLQEACAESGCAFIFIPIDFPKDRATDAMFAMMEIATRVGHAIGCDPGILPADVTSIKAFSRRNQDVDPFALGWRVYLSPDGRNLAEAQVPPIIFPPIPTASQLMTSDKKIAIELNYDGSGRLGSGRLKVLGSHWMRPGAEYDIGTRGDAECLDAIKRLICDAYVSGCRMAIATTRKWNDDGLPLEDSDDGRSQETK
jgi:hypothetical protein